MRVEKTFLAAVVTLVQPQVEVVETPIAATRPVAVLQTAVEAKSQHLGCVGQRLGLRPGGETQLRVDLKILLHHRAPPVKDLRQLR